MATLVETNYARNLFSIMEKWHVLPTEKRFQELADEQLEFMMLSIAVSNKYADILAKGGDPDSMAVDTTYDEEISGKSGDDLVLLKEGHDEADISQQVNKLTTVKFQEQHVERIGGVVDELRENTSDEAIQKTSEVTQYMEKQLEELRQEAKEMTDSYREKTADTTEHKNKELSEAFKDFDDSFDDL